MQVCNGYADGRITSEVVSQFYEVP